MVLLRVIFSKIFPHLDRILTIDNDTIVRENISELWDLNLDDYYVAGCPEYRKTNKQFSYINMGVAMINLKKFREDGMDDRLLNDLNTYFFFEAEQSAINQACQGHILMLDSMYNKNNYTYKDITNEKIIHYAALKGWQEFPLIKKYRDIEIVRNKPTPCNVDIIIPFYNNVKGLERTLKSINPELATITVVNDGSDKIDGYDLLKQTFSYVKFLDLPYNMGPGAARQYGIEHTSNPYFMFIDTGDYFLEQPLKEAIEYVKTHTQIYIFAYSWFNEEDNNTIANDAGTLPGKIFKREFIELYNLRMSSDPKCSYSNEDRGFLYTCQIIIQDIKVSDKTERFEPIDRIIYMRTYDENSITNSNKREFFYNKHFQGLVYNTEHMINMCKENNVSFKVYMAQVMLIFLYIYQCYLQCAAEKPENIPIIMPYLKYFYANIFKPFEKVCVKILTHYYSRMLPGMRKWISPTEPRININRFIDKIKN